VFLAAIVERDAVFIPADGDNSKTAGILLKSVHRLKLTDLLSDDFVKQFLRRVISLLFRSVGSTLASSHDKELVMAEHGQTFLARLRLTLERAASPRRSIRLRSPVILDVSIRLFRRRVGYWLFPEH
jgi:hypothetical protein